MSEPLAPSTNLLYTGTGEPLPARVELRAGPLVAQYERGDLRWIRHGEAEVLRRVYGAVRDRNWGTVAPEIKDERIEAGADWFRVTYTAHHRQGEIDFAWACEITGGADGAITFMMEGEARSTFWKNRIGLCVLHPASSAGALCRVEHIDGRVEEAALPAWIRPEQPVEPFARLGAIAHEYAPGRWAETRFEGDEFEMEDQRNWTDASFKTFGTPLRLPYPALIRAGERVRQRVTVRLRGEGAGRAGEAAGSGAVIKRIARQEDREEGRFVPISPVGLGMVSHGQDLSAREVSRLRALHLAHLRVDLDLAGEEWPRALETAAGQARALGCGLEAALLVDPLAYGGEFERLASLLERLVAPVTCALVLPRAEKSGHPQPLGGAVRAARRALGEKIPLYAGSSSDFILLQAALPPLEEVDGLAFAMNPQVHAFDLASMVETLEAQPQVAASALRLAGGRGLRLGPVTLRPRFNPYASAAAESRPGELPPQVDARQASLFGAGWALGSLAALVTAGAGLIGLTYFETTGWRGVMETESGPPLPDKFPSRSGEVYPLYFPFAWLGAFAGGEAARLQCSDPLSASGLCLRRGGRLRWMVANHTGQALALRVEGVPPGAVCRVLDETSAARALAAPEEFLAQPGLPVAVNGGAGELALRPFALACVDGDIG